MNTDTGEIKEYTKEELEKMPENESRKLKVLTQEQVRKLIPMNRHARRKYYATHKKEFAGKSWNEVKDLI